MLNTQATPHPDRAYFYAHLQLKVSSDFPIGDSEIALRLVELDSGRKVNLRFDSRQPLYAAEVPPGRYQLKIILFLDNLNLVQGEKALLAKGQPWTFRVRPGRAYYVGDAEGTLGWRGVGKRRFQWRVHAFEDRFPETTRAFRKRYKGLRTVPVINALVNEGMPGTPVLLAGFKGGPEPGAKPGLF